MLSAKLNMPTAAASSTAGKEAESSALAAPATTAGARQPVSSLTKINDPNMADGRLAVNRRCIYERALPGDACITAHAERLQHGYFASEKTSDPEVPHVDFLAVNFVFHPGDSEKHRFKAANIKATIQNAPTNELSQYPYAHPQENPKFLMHAPHLIYGAVSPETLQWTFSLAGSLGISDSPVSASLSPSGSRKASYKVYDMMKIQGSCRTLRSSNGPEFNVEDGEVVWTLTENSLQRSGLPREFTFVMLVQKPSADSRLLFKLEIDPVIDAWYGTYPTWWLNRPNYQPQPKRPLNFQHQVGQQFTPVDPKKNLFNFAKLASSLDEYVNMPGSTSSSNISPDGVYSGPSGKGSGSSHPSQSESSTGGKNNYNNSQSVYITEYPQYPSSQEATHYPLIRNFGQAWEGDPPFQQGSSRGDHYYGNGTNVNPNGNSYNPETTINLRVLLDSNFTSQIAAATLGVPLRHASPLLKAPPGRNASPASNETIGTSGINGTNEASSKRIRSLRRTRSSDRLNRLSASPSSFVDVDTDAAHQPTKTNGTKKTHSTRNGMFSSHEIDSMYEINNTPPPDNIRDPCIVNGQGSTTPPTPPSNMNYSSSPNGVTKLTLSNGISTSRVNSGNRYVGARPSSQTRNEYPKRFSYPLQSTDYK